jgi:hypothetical protein
MAWCWLVGNVTPVLDPIWALTPAFSERFGTEDRYRIGDAAHVCKELVVKAKLGRGRRPTRPRIRRNVPRPDPVR